MITVNDKSDRLFDVQKYRIKCFARKDNFKASTIISHVWFHSNHTSLFISIKKPKIVNVLRCWLFFRVRVFRLMLNNWRARRCDCGSKLSRVRWLCRRCYLVAPVSYSFIKRLEGNGEWRCGTLMIVKRHSVVRTATGGACSRRNFQGEGRCNVANRRQCTSRLHFEGKGWGCLDLGIVGAI